MNDQRLYIDDTLVDLSPSTSVTLDIKSGLFADAKTLTSSRTYTIKLPRTTHNEKVFGYPFTPSSSQRYPYKTHTASFYRNGVEIIRDGVAYVLGVDDEIEISIVWGVGEALRDIFEGGMLISELSQFYDGLIQYTADTIIDTTLAGIQSSGVGFAAIDTLKHPESSGIGEYNTLYETDAAAKYLQYRMTYQLPSVMVSKLVSLLTAANVGRAITFDFEDDTDLLAWFNTLCIPIASVKTDASRQGTTPLIATYGGYRNAIAWTTTQPISQFTAYETTTIDGTEYVIGWKATEDLDVSLTLSVVMEFTKSEYDLRQSYRSLYATMYTSARTGLILDTMTITDPDGNTWVDDGSTNRTGTFTISATFSKSDVSLDADEPISSFDVRLGKWVPRGALEFLQITSATLTINASSENVLYGSSYYYVFNLPKVKISDMLNCLAMLTATFPTLTSDGDVVYVPIQKVFDNKANAVDWSRKLMQKDISGTPRSIDFSLSNWCRQNWYRWKGNDDVTDHDGTIDVDNDTLTASRDVMTMPFSASDYNHVPFFESETTFVTIDELAAILFPSTANTITDTPKVSNTDPRLLVAQEFEINKTIDGTTYNYTRLRAVFDETLDLQNVIDSRYGDFTDAMQNVKVLKEHFNLTDIDIKTFDPTIPIYLAQYGRFYAVYEIKQQSSGVAEVTLFQLN